MPDRQHYLGRLVGTRPHWPEEMTEAEQRVMDRHFVYLRRLVWEGKVLLAGPASDPVFGLVALEVANEAEAWEILGQDPSVLAGLHEVQLQPFHASLLAGREAWEETTRPVAIDKSVVLAAPRAAAWRAWTTKEGLESFFAQEARVELRPGGRYEILFAPPDAVPPGERGAEGCRVLAFLPGEMLAFSWNAPPSLPAIRPRRTQVVLTFADAEGGGTALRLVNHGYGEGEDWDAAYAYFDDAWSRVLESLAKTLGSGAS